MLSADILVVGIGIGRGHYQRIPDIPERPMPYREDIEQNMPSGSVAARLIA
jgi:hypothetical protein